MIVRYGMLSNCQNMKTTFWILANFLSLPLGMAYPHVSAPKVLYVWVSSAQLKNWNQNGPSLESFGPSTVEGQSLPVSITGGIRAWTEPWEASETSDHLLKLILDTDDTASFSVFLKEKSDLQNAAELKSADFILLKDEGTEFQEWIILNPKRIKAFSLISGPVATRASLRARMKGAKNFSGWSLVIN